MSSKKTRSIATWTSISTMLLLVSMVVLSGICFLAGFLFLWQDKAGAWAPLLIGLLILGATIVGWFILQKKADFTEPETTSIADRQGNQIVTQTRALESPLIVQNLGDLLQQMPRRESWPKEEIDEEIEDEQESPVSPPVEVHRDEAGTAHPS